MQFQWVCTPARNRNPMNFNGSASGWIQQLGPNLLGLAQETQTNGITGEESQQESDAIPMGLHPSSGKIF